MSTFSLLEIADVLAELTPERREQLEVRLERWWPDVHAGLADVYPADDLPDLEARLLRLVGEAVRDRDPELARLDLVRQLDPGWFQSERMVGYACYADRFAGTLDGVRRHVDYLRELGVTYLHLMPVLQPRDGDNDGGYAVADYRQVRGDLGTMADLRALAADLRANGISLVADLVLNHVAREHAWAAAARAGDERYRRYFHVFEDRTLPDAYEATLPEVFPDFAPGNFTWDDDLRGWVWTTFNEWQWDVRWANPDVFVEYADIVLFLAQAGVEVVRLDAIAFVWKELGTTCQNRPQVHAITQALRALVRVAAPAVIFKAEAIVAPQDLVHYLGRGTHHGKVSDLAYHNSLMVQVWSMLAARDVRLAARALQAMPPVPSSTAWITYVRCHDDIGWAVDDRDAAAVGLDGHLHRAFLSDWYSGEFPGSPAEGLVFQYNPATGDRRISGSAAGLLGLDRAVRDDDEAAVTRAVNRLLLAHAMVAGFGGIPVLWMGDELGLPDDADWASEPGHADDNRWVHRPRMPWDRAGLRHTSGTVEERVFAGVRHVLRVRAETAHLHASVAAEVLEPSDPGVLAVLRRHPLGPFLALYNVTDDWRPFPAGRLAELGLARAHDVLADEDVAGGPDANLWLAPLASRWLAAR
jgi:amylosucrase